MDEETVDAGEGDGLLIGVGNPWRGDDGLGPVLARRLRPVLGERVLELPGTGADLMAAWTGWRRVVVVDAAQSGARPGTLFRFDAIQRPLPAGFFAATSHTFGVAEAVAMARVLETLPERLVIYAVEGGDFAAGAGLSAAVAAVLDDLEARVLAELRS